MVVVYICEQYCIGYGLAGERIRFTNFVHRGIYINIQLVPTQNKTRVCNRNNTYIIFYIVLISFCVIHLRFKYKNYPDRHKNKNYYQFYSNFHKLIIPQTLSRSGDPVSGTKNNHYEIKLKIWLPMLDAFRTLNWTNIKSELQFSNILNIKQLAPNLA